MASCSNTKFLKDGELLYTGSKIKIIGDSLSKKQKTNLKNSLESQLVPKPNKSIFGLRPKLFIYNIAPKPTKDKGFKYWLKYTVGEKPVLLKNVDTDFMRSIIDNYSENEGYFNISSNYEVVTKEKKAEVIYNIQPKTQYTIGKVIFNTNDSEVTQAILKTANQTLLKIGSPFNLDVIKNERIRIDSYLKENGYYYFHPDDILVQVDSTVGHHKVDLIVKVKNNTPVISKEPFTIERVIVFADYKINSNQTHTRRKNRTIDLQKRDSLLNNNGIVIIDRKKLFKPEIFDRALYFKKGDLYNLTDQNLSLSRLINLGTFKFVKNEFVISDSINHKFDAYYYLTPNEFKSLRFEFLAKTNSAGYAGSELNLNWSNRNFFKGAELFTASIYGGFEYQIGGIKDANNIYRIGSKFNLLFPKIIAPFSFKSSSAYVPRTKVALGYEYQNRTQLYALHNFNASFGYVWKENVRKEHELSILDVTFVTPETITDKYKQQMQDNVSLQRVVEKQLVFGPSYSYTYTNTMFPLKNTIYYQGSVDLSANIIGIISGANIRKGKQKEILGVPYSQFVKTEHDFRYYRKLGARSQLATRILGGIGYAYGNSEYMPFSKQFFIGGANSIRAFRARTLGPGSYDPRTESGSFLHDQSGDIKMEFNIEYRPHLFGIVNGAVFIDAGNVWNLNKVPSKPGGQFTNDFYKEIAVGTGVGLRFDFSILIFRTDLAFPIRVPYYKEGERWNFRNIDFSNRQWRRDNLILNIAIGYPF